MPRNIADPVALAPDTRPDTDARVQLHAHLKVSLQNRLGHRKASAGGGLALEALYHGLMVALLVWLGLGRCRVDGRAVNGFVEDRVIWVMLFHCGEIVGAFKEMLALARGVLRAHGLAVNALGGEALLLFALVLVWRGGSP